jgi:glucan biosynthesis protein C
MRRLLYIDNLRWVMIMLVVSMHAAVTYSHLGSWYYMEDSPVSSLETTLFATYQVSLQSFFMGFLFFLAGYFVPGAYDTKGPARFLRDRGFRLGIPLLLYVFVLQPVAVYCISLFHGEDVYPHGFVRGYERYLTSGRWLGGTGPLWFCEALLIFCLAYAGLRALDRRAAAAPGVATGAASDAAGAPGAAGAGSAAPSRARVWAFIGLITLGTFLVRFPWPNGTAFYNLQFCYFTQYIFFFWAGTLAYRGRWLGRLSIRDGKYWGRVALFGGLAGWIALLVFGGALRGETLAYRGGLHWQSLGMALWESMMGVAISLFLLGWFRERFDRQGPLARYFSASAFAVYVFHAPVLIALSRAMSYLRGPLLLKFLVLTLCGILVTYFLCSLLLRRLPLLKRIL